MLFSVLRLQNYGVILVGKANMHELGLGTIGNNANHGCQYRATGKEKLSHPHLADALNKNSGTLNWQIGIVGINVIANAPRQLCVSSMEISIRSQGKILIDAMDETPFRDRIDTLLCIPKTYPGTPPDILDHELT
ncbi:hypothetical protein BC332_11074 [Capsicum chinense]|nr:hypothetical protein BC332_11074 [Capsicum chinense]